MEEDIKQALAAILEEAMCRLEELAGAKFARSVSVGWNKRMRSTAGRAFWPEARVELNPKLLSISLEEVRRTLLHELAHLLAYHRCGRRRIAPHGVEWQQACADLGIPGERATHQLALPRRLQAKKWRYCCPSCGEAIERVRKMRRYVACYSCCQKYNGGRYNKRFELVVEAL
ncbi:SprT-like domain-containing protein [Rubritalea tangerina]|uniref:SprT-like domain-containing protein n=1 Tax=Rubritalea tangerina TaxID=430798 RepID=A0ABW4Z8F4_9BACT